MMTLPERENFVSPGIIVKVQGKFGLRPGNVVTEVGRFAFLLSCLRLTKPI